MNRAGFQLDLSRCVGCGACVIACRIERYGSDGEPRYTAAFKKRRVFMAARIGITDLLTVLILVILGPAAALFPATIGVFIDRYSFYALGAQHTTEAEIARVESIMRTGKL